MFDARTNLSAEVAAEVRDAPRDGAVFDTVVPRSVRLAEAPSHGRPIALYAPDSRGADGLPGARDRAAVRLDQEAGRHGVVPEVVPAARRRRRRPRARMTHPCRSRSRARTCRSTQARAHPAGWPDGAAGIAWPRPRRAHPAGRLHDARAGGHPARPHRAEPLPAAQPCSRRTSWTSSREHRGARRPAARARHRDARGLPARSRASVGSAPRSSPA